VAAAAAAVRRRAVARLWEVPTLLPGLDGKVVASRRHGLPAVLAPAVSAGGRSRADTPRRPGWGSAWGAGRAARAIAQRE